MEFISAEEFLKQDEDVQKILLEWWENNCSSYDLITFVNDKSPRFYCDLEFGENYEGLIPLLTEGQLRKFIEDKTGGKIDTTYCDEGGYDIFIAKGNRNRKVLYLKYNLGNDLLEVYWKVAIEIAERETRQAN